MDGTCESYLEIIMITSGTQESYLANSIFNFYLQKYREMPNHMPTCMITCLFNCQNYKAKPVSVRKRCQHRLGCIYSAKRGGNSNN